MLQKNVPLLVTSALALLSVVFFRSYLKWVGLDFTKQVGDVAALLAPLAVTATIIERTVEILISPWRDGGANTLQRAIDAIKTRPADPAANAQNSADLKVATDALDSYRGKTQQYAFATSLTLGMLASIAGIRALWQFVDHENFLKPEVALDPQHIFFLCLDVALSAALLAGGADGIHSVMNAITSFFDASADKSKH